MGVLEHLQRFFQERLMPAIQELGGPAPTQPQIFQIYNLIQVPGRTRSG